MRGTPLNAVDPTGHVIVFVHGISNFNDYEIGFVYRQLRESSGSKDFQSLIHFTYSAFDGSEGRGEAPGMGTAWRDICDDVNLKAAASLANLLFSLNEERLRLKSSEPIYIMAYSNGSNVAYSALRFGGDADALLLIGGSIDIDTNFEGMGLPVHVYWSQLDEATSWVDGIGFQGVDSGVGFIVHNEPYAFHSEDEAHRHGYSGVEASNTWLVPRDPSNLENPIHRTFVPHVGLPNNATTWLTKYMASEYYIKEVSGLGDFRVSRRAVLPNGTHLRPNTIFRYDYVYIP